MKPPSRIATGIVLSACGIAALTASFPPSAAAWISGLGLLGAFAWEASGREPREWFRIDWAALAAGYYLTLAEFLFPQEQFLREVDPAAAGDAIRLVLCGLAGLSIGRHLIWPRIPVPTITEPSRREWLGLLLFCFVLGHYYMMASVGFNPVRFVKELFGPRFSQPWARDRLGDSRALLSELRLLNYLVPPITAWLLVRGDLRPLHRVLTVLPLAGLIFVSFCGGTRYVLATHLATFVTALAWSWPGLNRERALLLFGAPLLTILVVTVLALQFRHQGLARTLDPNRAKPKHRPPQHFVVDNNLRTIAKLTQVFPQQHPYLGWEIPLHILLRPLPRAFVPAKPTKLSFSMEEVVQIPQTSIASTFVGEGYLMAGAAGTVLFGLILGGLCGLWNQITRGSPGAVAIVLYASGFHWALLTARSPIWFSIGLLPCLFLLLVVILAFPVARRLLPAQGGACHGSARV
jgi:hypothetical protein